MKKFWSWFWPERKPCEPRRVNVKRCRVVVTYKSGEQYERWFEGYCLFHDDWWLPTEAWAVVKDHFSSRWYVTLDRVRINMDLIKSWKVLETEDFYITEMQ